MRTLHEIIVAEYHATGRRGQPPVAFIRQWRRQNIEYGRWPLYTSFAPGSTLAYRGPTALDRASAAWLSRHPDEPPQGPEFEALVAEVKAASEKLEAATRPPADS